MKRTNTFFVQAAILYVFLIIFSACSGSDYQQSAEKVTYRFLKKNEADTARKATKGEYVLIIPTFYTEKDSAFLHHNMKKNNEAVECIPVDNKSFKDVMTMLSVGDSVSMIVPASELFGINLSRYPFLSPTSKVKVNLGIRGILSEKEYKKYEMKRMTRILEETRKENERKLSEMQNSPEGKKQDSLLNAHFQAKKISPQKDELGFYYLVHNEGASPKIQKGEQATFDYSVLSLDGKKLMDSADKPVSLVVDFTQGLFGVHKALKMLGKGGKATLYLPAYLAFGARGMPNSGVGPNQPLIYELSIREVGVQPNFNIQK